MSHPEDFMRIALDLARRGLGRTRPNPPVGALVVCDGVIVGKGFHPRAGEPHAEIFALREAAERARGADLYVTLEPCSHQGRTGPCCEAVAEAGIRRVYIGARDPNPQVNGGGVRFLQQHGIETLEGVLGADCRRLIAPFAKHVTTGLPFVILKSAMTLDGFTACAGGDSRWVSSESSRILVHRLRDQLDAIMVGIGTVEKDAPLLNVRLIEGGRDPLRIVVDSALRIDEQAPLLVQQSTAGTLIATTERAETEKIARLRRRGIDVVVLPAASGQVDLRALWRHLGDMQIQSVLLEGGATLAGTAIRQALIDRVMIFVAPKLLGGGDGLGIFAGPGVPTMATALPLEEVRVCRCDEDILIEGDMRHVYRPY